MLLMYQPATALDGTTTLVVLHHYDAYLSVVGPEVCLCSQLTTPKPHAVASVAFGSGKD